LTELSGHTALPDYNRTFRIAGENVFLLPKPVGRNLLLHDESLALGVSLAKLSL
jgi:hypothetical protein